VKRNPTEAVLVLVLGGWFTSMLFPSQSVWIEWAFYAGVMLFVLWRLALVCGRAMGKLPAPSVNWFLDLFVTAWLIAMVASFFIYQVRALGIPVIGTLFWWGLGADVDRATLLVGQVGRYLTAGSTSRTRPWRPSTHPFLKCGVRCRRTTD
jgi:hypothetical protein